MNGHGHRQALTLLLSGATMLTVACGSEAKTEGAADTAAREVAQAPESAGTGRVILVEAYSDEKGNYYKPNRIEAHKGDIVRLVLKSGVHNMNFLADSNAGKSGLPAASDMLQLPDQTHDIKVTLGEGHYFFQCDPHAALGMTGHLEVED